MKITLKTIHEDLLEIKKLLQPTESVVVSEPASTIKWTKIGNLEWSEDLGKMNLNDAVIKCKEIGGRLPTIKEWKNLYKNHTEEYKKMLISSPYSYYWSATTLSGYTQNAWYTVLGSGYTGYFTKTETLRVRCVR